MRTYNNSRVTFLSFLSSRAHSLPSRHPLAATTVLMGTSEIDDIFAGKRKSLPTSATASTSKAPEPSKKKKKTANKRKRESVVPPADGAPDGTADDAVVEKPAKRRVPETILDPSVHVAAASTTTKPPKAGRQPEVLKKHKKANKEDEQRFKDSRGTGPSRFPFAAHLVFFCNVIAVRAQDGGGLFDLQRGRTRHHRARRRYAVVMRPLYPEADDNLVDTPLCPFDCQCCE